MSCKVRNYYFYCTRGTNTRRISPLLLESLSQCFPEEYSKIGIFFIHHTVTGVSLLTKLSESLYTIFLISFIFRKHHCVRITYVGTYWIWIGFRNRTFYDFQWCRQKIKHTIIDFYCTQNTRDGN